MTGERTREEDATGAPTEDEPATGTPVGDRDGAWAEGEPPAGQQAAAGTAALVALAARRIRRTGPRLGHTRLACVDGPAGSGKTTLAAALARDLGGCPVVHMDDLCAGWSGMEGAWALLETYVLAPLREGRPGRHPCWDWDRDTFGEWRDVPAGPYLVLEGCGSARREADAVAAVRIWVEAADDVRLSRGLARDGLQLRDSWLAWMAGERDHFARNRTRERADLRLRTG